MQLVDAASWIKNNPNPNCFAGNRFESKIQALEFIDQLYQLGAKKVSVDTDQALDEEWRIQREGGPYVDALVVELPEDIKQKKQLAALFVKENEELQYEPEAIPIVSEEILGRDQITFWWD